MTDINQIVLAACRAHAPQFDQMDVEIQKYALLQMRSALTVGVTGLVKAGRSILDHGGDQDYAAFDAALEPFDELIPYDSTIEADISAAMSAIEELPYECDSCTTPGYGSDAQCNCSPSPTERLTPLRASAPVKGETEDNIGQYEQALRDALEWYGEQARLARLIHSEGDKGRLALAEDGGKRAREVLAHASHAEGKI